jgi:hypothetical protein
MEDTNFDLPFERIVVGDDEGLGVDRCGQYFRGDGLGRQPSLNRPRPSSSTTQ